MNLPTISIIITSYHPPSKKYLDLCISSIENLDYPRELLDIVLVTRKGYEPHYPGVRTVWPADKETFHNPVGVNFGASQATGQYLMFVNDDVIFTRNSLKNLMKVSNDADAIFTPISPCDNYFKYQLIFGVDKGGQFHRLDQRFYRYSDLQPLLPEMMNQNSVYSAGILPVRKHCLYAFLLKRSVWDKIGGFDENFKTGQDDYDFCLRAEKENVPIFISLDCLIWHFGGVSADTTMTTDLRSQSIEYFKQKWPGESL